MAYDSAHRKVVLFGGSDSSSSSLGDTWVWDGTNWTQNFPATSPPARAFHSMAYDAARGQVVLFGGCCTSASGGDFNDTWVWTVRLGRRNPRRLSHRRGTMVGFLAYDEARQQVVMFSGGISRFAKFRTPGFGMGPIGHRNFRPRVLRREAFSRWPMMRLGGK